MKIKLYIVTYKGHKRLPITLNSIFFSQIPSNVKLEVNIINNHSDIRIPQQFLSDVNVLHNNLRPDFSTGHLSRNWNQAIINGFKDLQHPDCDILVCSQDDSVFRPDWAIKLKEFMTGNEFIQGGHGDQFHAYKANHVRKVGLWDERFCGLSRQAADYFLRSVAFNSCNVSIQDVLHHRIYRPINPENINAARGFFVDPDVRKIDDVWDNSSDNNNKISIDLMQAKYGEDPYPWSDMEYWVRKAFENKLFHCSNYITYPYFEKDVIDLKGKRYLGY